MSETDERGLECTFWPDPSYTKSCCCEFQTRKVHQEKKGRNGKLIPPSNPANPFTFLEPHDQETGEFHDIQGSGQRILKIKNCEKARWDCACLFLFNLDISEKANWLKEFNDLIPVLGSTIIQCFEIEQLLLVIRRVWSANRRHFFEAVSLLRTAGSKKRGPAILIRAFLH